MNLNCSESNGGLRPGAIVGGSFLLLVGVTMFLERAGLADIAPWRIIGPACLIILGASMLFNTGVIGAGRKTGDSASGEGRRGDDRRRGGLTGGLWLMGVGCWMIVSQLNLFGLDYGKSWPLLIVLSGIIMLVRTTSRRIE